MGFCNEYSDIGDISVVATFAALPTGAARYPGKYVYISADDRLVYWNGTAWVDPSGAVAVVATQAALPTGAGRYPGRQAYILADQRLVYWNGTGWVIISEPTTQYSLVGSIAGITLGSGGTATGWYHRSDGWCTFRFQITLGSGGTMGNPIMNTPQTALSQSALQGACGSNAVLADTGVAAYVGITSAANSYTIGLFSLGVGGSFGQYNAINSTSPFTWGSGDEVYGQITFQMSTRHSF